MDYTSHTEEDLERILSALGVKSVDELIDQIIPKQLQYGKRLDIPDCAPEASLSREFNELAAMNKAAVNNLCYLGGGSYDHYVPAAVGAITGRSEFSTAYTPYQAEVSQGTLQTIYEFQTMIAKLTGMEAANASHYDGSTALAEGALMGLRKTRKRKIIVPFGLNPSYRTVLETYCKPAGNEIVTLKHKNGVTDIADLRANIDDAGVVVVQHPNYFGLLEPATKIAEIAHENNALVVSSTYPTSLALLKPPGEWGADIATAEGQALGVPMSLGGPYLGLFAVRKQFIRQMPGRLVARAKDKKDRDGFVLTLQTREQHIRRDKATSNICTNEALVALSALVYLSLVGRDGLKQIALDSYRRTHYLADELTKISGCHLHFEGEFFNEFVLDLPKNAGEIQNALAEEGIFAGPLLNESFEGMDNSLLVAVTEKRTREDLDKFVTILKEMV